MSNLFLLTKVSLANFFDFHKIVNSSSKEERKKSIYKTILMTLAYFFLAYSLYDLVISTMPEFINANIPEMALATAFAITSIFIIFMTVLKCQATLFEFKDYNFLMSLPVKRKTILNSKMLTNYVLNMLIVFIYMIPTFLGYIKFIDVNFIFVISFILLLFIIPIVPMIIGYLIGLLILLIVGNFKNKNVANYILSFSILITVVLLSNKMENMTSMELVKAGNNFVNMINNYYPLTEVYINILKGFDVISLLIFIIVPIVLCLIFDLVLDYVYPYIQRRLSKTNIIRNYKIKDNKVRKPLSSLYNKEIKRYLSSSNYVLNTLSGCVLLIISLIMLVIFGNNKVEELLKIEGLGSMICLYGPFIISFFLVCSTSTSSSISIEGKTIYLLKSLPIETNKIFESKVYQNLTYTIPTSIIASLIIGIYFKMNISTFMLIIFIPILYAIFISLIGLILNLHYYDFDWENEIKVIKQSAAPLFTLFIGIISVFLPIYLYNGKGNIYLLYVLLIIAVIDLILILYLRTKGVEKFKRL